MNTLNHCVEGLALRRRPVLSEALLCKVFIELVAATDPRAETRCGPRSPGRWPAITLSGSWLTHAIGHVIGARHRGPHDWCHAVIGGHVVRFNAPGGRRRARANRAAGGPGRGLRQPGRWLDTRSHGLGAAPNPRRALASPSRNCPRSVAEHGVTTTPSTARAGRARTKSSTCSQSAH